MTAFPEPCRSLEECRYGSVQVLGSAEHAATARGGDAQGELVAALGFEPDSGHHHVPRQRAGHEDAQGESCVVLTCGVTNTPYHLRRKSVTILL